MKKVKMTFLMTLSDEEYNSDGFQDLKNSILSGKFQRDMMENEHPKVDMKSFKATIETMKDG